MALFTLAAPVNVESDGVVLLGEVTRPVVGDATPRGAVEVIPATELMVLFEKDPVLYAVELSFGAPVATAQVAQATLEVTVIGITAVQGQSVMVIVVASVIVEVSEPWVRTVGPGQ